MTNAFTISGKQNPALIGAHNLAGRVDGYTDLRGPPLANDGGHKRALVSRTRVRLQTGILAMSGPKLVCLCSFHLIKTHRVQRECLQPTVQSILVRFLRWRHDAPLECLNRKVGTEHRSESWWSIGPMFWSHCHSNMHAFLELLQDKAFFLRRIGRSGPNAEGKDCMHLECSMPALIRGALWL